MNLPKSCRDKVDRARQHFDDLTSRIGDVFKTDPDSVWKLAKKFHSDESCFTLRIEWMVPMPDEWGLILGDIIHNLRGALDHLAWELVLGGTDPNPKSPGQVMFPIHDDIPGYTKRVDDRLPGVGAQARGIIEGFQPYHGKPVEHHPLHVLRELSNTDKHRVPNLIYPRAAQVKWIIDTAESHNCTDERVDLAEEINPLRAGVELGRVFVNVTGPEPDVKIRTETFIQPTFENGLPATAWLEMMFAAVTNILNRFETL